MMLCVQQHLNTEMAGGWVGVEICNLGRPSLCGVHHLTEFVENE